MLNMIVHSSQWEHLCKSLYWCTSQLCKHTSTDMDTILPSSSHLHKHTVLWHGDHPSIVITTLQAPSILTRILFFSHHHNFTSAQYPDIWISSFSHHNCMYFHHIQSHPYWMSPYLSLSNPSRSRSSFVFSSSMTTLCFSMTLLVGSSESPICSTQKKIRNATLPLVLSIRNVDSSITGMGRHNMCRRFAGN